MSSSTQVSIPADRAATVIQDLIQVKEGANQLKTRLRDSIQFDPTAEKIMDDMLEKLSNTLSVLHSGEATSDPGPTIRCGSLCSDDRKSESSSGGKRKSVPIGIIDKRGGCRRRSQSFSGRQVIAKSLDDGQTWRKYGQKEIQNSPHPRSYFRCTHRPDQHCMATRQVQRSDDDPSTFVISYFGEHTCRDPSTIPQIIETSDPVETNSVYISFGSKNHRILSKPVASSFRSLAQADQCNEEVLSNLTPGSSPAECFMPGDELAAVVSPACRMQSNTVGSFPEQGEMMSSFHSSPASLETEFMASSFGIEQEFTLFGFDHGDGDFPPSLR